MDRASAAHRAPEADLPPLLGGVARRRSGHGDGGQGPRGGAMDDRPVPARPSSTVCMSPPVPESRAGYAQRFPAQPSGMTFDYPSTALRYKCNLCVAQPARLPFNAPPWMQEQRHRAATVAGEFRSFPLSAPVPGCGLQTLNSVQDFTSLCPDFRGLQPAAWHEKDPSAGRPCGNDFAFRILGLGAAFISRSWLPGRLRRLARPRIPACCLIPPALSIFTDHIACPFKSGLFDMSP